MDIEIRNLYFAYPTGVEAVRDISLSIASGEQAAIVGQNGAGKTTLVKHLNGLLQPTRGQVLIGDWDTTKHSVAQLASRVGYVFQNPDEQLFSRNVSAEVAFGPRNLGFRGERLQALVRDALALTDLVDKTEANPYDLSVTWRKMVAIASILSMDTNIVIFDEPTPAQVIEQLKKSCPPVRFVAHVDRLDVQVVALGGDVELVRSPRHVGEIERGDADVLLVDEDLSSRHVAVDAQARGSAPALLLLLPLVLWSRSPYSRTNAGRGLH